MPHTLNLSDISTQLHITVMFVYDLPEGTVLLVRTHWLVSYTLQTENQRKWLQDSHIWNKEYRII